MRNLNFYTKKLEDKIQDFIFHNATIRKIRGFFNTIIFPYFVRFVLIFLSLIIITFFTLKLFKPDALDKIYFKTSSYFFHHLNLDNYDFSSIQITGLKRIEEEKILEIIKETKKDFAKNNSYKKSDSLIKLLAQNIKKNQEWVDKINISRTLPNHLNIVIVEYNPFAIWQDGAKKYVIDREGNKVSIDDDEEFQYLIILSGRDANLNVKSLFNILTTNPEISADIYSATWVGNRRWNIRFSNGILAKLPSSNLDEAWQNLIRIYNTKGALKDLEVIDLRIDKKTYLEYKDNKK